MKKSTLNLAIILVGSGLLIYDLTGENHNVYLKIAAFAMLMFGLYNLTQNVISNEAVEDKGFSDEENQ